ncbi:MAG: hypothetical protein GY698_21590 [Actinomycetia bacterium]|nr:hypothetical protein [Actinomycetes bacterium]
MTDIGTYSFLPWARQGIANKISAQDQDATVNSRATIDVALRIIGKGVDGAADVQRDITRKVELYGPGDVVGIDSRAIIRTEPLNWVTNFEPNYLPYIDFYDEDFAWRYTPSAALTAKPKRLKPWLALVVLEEGEGARPSEFADGRNLAGKPLPYIVVSDRSVFPDAADLWAWAHVHVNQSLIADPNDVSVPNENDNAVLNRFEQVIGSSPDEAYCRLVSPRKLRPNTAYHAFVVPTYETGRLAGLGLDPDNAPHATHAAWTDYPNGTRDEPGHYPVYHRWYFRTSTVGDFEYLVRLLQPQPMDSRVGRRDMDVQAPGSNLPAITDPALGGVLKLGGALRVPEATLAWAEKSEAAKYENWDQPAPHPFQERLAELVNLADDYTVESVKDAHDATLLVGLDPTDNNPDPLITAPLYGRWHALTQRLLTERDGTPAPNAENWVHELNLDPRFRTAAGFGAGVVQDNQNAYMEAAWEQIGDVIEANRQIRLAQMAVQVSSVWYTKHITAIATHSRDRFFQLTAPVDRRVVIEGVTRRFAQSTTLVPPSVLSAPMRRIARPRGRLIRSLEIPDDIASTGIVERLNRGEIRAVPPKVIPPALPTVDKLADEVRGSGAVGGFLGWLRSLPRIGWLLLAALLVVLVIVLFVVNPVVAIGAIVVIAVGGLVLYFLLKRRNRLLDALGGIGEDQPPDEAIDALPTDSDFKLTLPSAPATGTVSGPDNTTAARFKQGLRDALVLIDAANTATPDVTLVPWDLTATATGTLRALDTTRTIPTRVLGRVRIPGRIAGKLVEQFVEPMAYPEFDMPMYKPLIDISDDLFLPNLEFVPNNSISLLETNQRFIEAYMVGLNHEMARELLWNEYITDQRGTYFRQFWDVSSVLVPQGADPETTKESLRDIPPLHRWSRTSALGDHDHREKPGENDNEIVLVIRGELLKKYPNAVILAHRAEWQLDSNGTIDKTVPRKLVDLTAAEQADPPPSKVKTSLYEAKVEPDIHFFGFDLTALEARGETPTSPDDPGWFVVIKERPGEPRFGLDVDQDGVPGGVKNHWGDFSWGDVMPGLVDGGFLSATAAPTANFTAPPGSATDGEKSQHNEDSQIVWDADVGAAELAYILYQVPVLVAVHASRMLPDGGA